jgi:D-alanyl-D-alanine dipeptidase
MKRRTALALLSTGIAGPLQASPRDPALKPLRACRQLLRVETAGWKSPAGILTLWMRNKDDSAWQPAGPPLPVIVGKGGLRWGRGLHKVPDGGVIKQEGDLCSPAGIFRLDTAFGVMPAKQAAVRWPWQQMTPAHAGVDDPRSRFYNRIVDSARVRNDWKSAENMMPKSGAYRCGVVVRHNWDQKPGAGSCIFLHVRTAGPTVGCTSMTEAAMLRVIRWLDPSANPLLVQLPAAEWKTRASEWGLPALSPIPKKGARAER